MPENMISFFQLMDKVGHLRNKYPTLTKDMD